MLIGASCFAVFLLGALGSVWVAPRWRARRLIATGCLAVALFNILLLATPFWGWISEAVLVLAGAAALSCVFAPIHNQGKSLKLGTFLFLSLAAPAVLAPVVNRVYCAQRIAWDCSGTVSAKFRSDNHQAAALTVQTPDGEVTLEGVDEGLWQAAAVGDSLVKHRASAFGTLNDRSMRVAPRGILRWWNEPRL